MNRIGAMRMAVATLLILAAAGTMTSPTAVAAPASSVAVCQNDFGSKTPVLLVHGFHEGTDVWASMTKAIQANPEVKVVTPFDYPNTQWVTDSSVGPKLAAVIRCLATDSKHNGGPGKVIIVAHSMGGLAVRCAVDQKCAGTGAVSQQQIGLVITLGTPNTGSLLATTGNGLSSAGVISCEIILALQTGLNLPCADLGSWLFGANTPAAQAMAIGLDGQPSQDLSALQALPSTIPLDAIAGQVTVTTSLFNLGPFQLNGPQVDLGDLVVPVASALDGAPPTSPAHPGTSTPHPGPGSGTLTISCGTVSLSNLLGPGPASVTPNVTCWHLTETTDPGWQAQVLAAINAAASALTPAPCTAAALTSAINAAKVESAGSWTLTGYACESGYSFVNISPQGLAVVAILKQQGPTWKIIYGPNEGLCLTEPLPSFCQGFKLPIPWPLLMSLMNKANSVTTTKAELYIGTVFTPGALYPYPSGPSKIGIDNHDYLTGLQWAAGSQGDLIGTGTLYFDNCTPDCGQGTYETFPVQIAASNPQRCTVQVYPNGLGNPSQAEQAEVFSQLDIRALQGSPPSFLVGNSVLPKPCSQPTTLCRRRSLLLNQVRHETGDQRPVIRRLRAAVGHDLLLLPSVSVLPVNAAGQVLLVRDAGHDDGWAVLGGAVEVGESPAKAAVREAREEIGADVRLLELLDVLGGPDYEVTYPNGDCAAYVTVVYEAEIISGAPAVADGELGEVAWFSRAELAHLTLSRLSHALLAAIGRI